MNLLVLALLAAATNTQPANTNGTTSKNTPSKVSAKSKTAKPAAQTDVAGNPVPATDGAAPTDGTTPPPPKKKKGDEAAAPDAGSPASLVGNSVDAATQIANEAAKAAMEEIKRLQAIGGDSAAPGPGAGKLVEAGVAGVFLELGVPREGVGIVDRRRDGERRRGLRQTDRTLDGGRAGPDDLVGAEPDRAADDARSGWASLRCDRRLRRQRRRLRGRRDHQRQGKDQPGREEPAQHSGHLHTTGEPIAAHGELDEGDLRGAGRRLGFVARSATVAAPP